MVSDDKGNEELNIDSLAEIAVALLVRARLLAIRHHETGTVVGCCSCRECVEVLGNADGTKGWRVLFKALNDHFDHHHPLKISQADGVTASANIVVPAEV